MRTAGLTMNDVWAGRVLHERGVEAYRFEGLDAELGVMVESIELKHRGKDEKYRPYLHLTGELRSLTPAQALPHGITEVTYSPGQGEKVDAYYEFDDQQLTELAGKGYFSSSFVVPEQITGIQWELPAIVDVLVLEPSAREGDAPVVFTQVRDIASLDIDLESCGYDVAAYFADHSKKGTGQLEAVVDERGLRARSDAINSLFAEEELDLFERKEQGISEAGQVPTASDAVGSHLRELEAQIEAERERYRASQRSTEGTPAHLYQERVASALRGDDEPSAGAASSAGLGDLDLSGDEAGDEQEIEREDRAGRRKHRQQQGTPVSLGARKRQVADRAADLDLGQDHGQSLGD